MLGQMTPQGIGQLRSLPHEQIPSSAHHRSGLSLFGLHDDEPHGRPCCRLGNGFCICRVILLPLHERLDVGGWNQPNVVTEFLDCTAPFMSSGARFPSRRCSDAVARGTGAFAIAIAFSGRRQRISKSAVRVEDPRCKVDSDDGDVVHVRLPTAANPQACMFDRRERAQEGHPFHQLLRGWGYDEQDDEQVLAPEARARVVRRVSSQRSGS